MYYKWVVSNWASWEADSGKNFNRQLLPRKALGINICGKEKKVAELNKGRS